VLYNLLTGYEPVALPPSDRAALHHRLHMWALAVPFMSFPLLNLPESICPAIIAIARGTGDDVLPSRSRPKIGRPALRGLHTVFLQSGVDGSRPHRAGLDLPALSALRCRPTDRGTIRRLCAYWSASMSTHLNQVSRSRHAANALSEQSD
jgi:hypothetical protein